MPAIGDAAWRRELTWDYPTTDNGPYVLRAGPEEVGSLHFVEQAGMRSSGWIGAARWTLAHTGGVHPHVTVYHDNSDDLLAEFKPALLGGGVVAFASGARYSRRKAHVWGGKWCFHREGDPSSVCLSQDAGPLMGGARVTVCPDAAKLPETPVLVLLAWYLRVLEFQMQAESISSVG